MRKKSNASSRPRAGSIYNNPCIRIKNVNGLCSRKSFRDIKRANLARLIERGRKPSSLYLFIRLIIKITLTAQGGHISLKYNLFVDDELVSHNSLRIIIKGEPPDEHL